MEVIRVIDCIDDIVEHCFKDPELVEILEFTTGLVKTTVKDLFLHHYETACYLGTKESLIRAIRIKIHNNEDLLLRIKDYKKNLSKILELGEYSRSRLNYRAELGSETSIGASAGNTHNENKQVDNYSGIDINTNLNINDSRTATSQTNKVEGINVVIPQPTIEVAEQPTRIKTFRLEDDRIAETADNYTRYKLNNPQYEEGEEKIGYQNLTKDITTNQTNDTNTSSSSRGGSSTGDSKSRSANTNVKGRKTDAHDTTVEFITNDARFKLWSRELPRLKTKFFNCFYHLFIYEPI